MRGERLTQSASDLVSAEHEVTHLRVRSVTEYAPVKKSTLTSIFLLRVGVRLRAGDDPVSTVPQACAANNLPAKSANRLRILVAEDRDRCWLVLAGLSSNAAAE